MTNQFNLQRFIDRQKEDFPIALKEIQNGRKQTHWMWWIFPQLKELGYSSISKEYGISGIEEARSYLEEPILRENLIAICNALLSLDTNDPYKVMGSTDGMKLRSSMTLFLEADPDNDVFKAVLDKYYGGRKDYKTLKLLGRN